MTLNHKVGDKHGRLTVLEILEKGPKCLCQCSCGVVKLVRIGDLVSGDARSCGCLHKELITTHGGTSGILFRVWEGMMARCYNTKQTFYSYYGGRGISVCDRWKNSPKAFAEDMGERPSSKHTLDRIDNDGDYTPENCRWATWNDQNRNKRGVKLTTQSVQEIRNENASGTSAKDLSLKFGISAGHVRDILNGKRWSLDTTAPPVLCL